MEKINFDYFYGTEAEEYFFYRFPKLLITDKRFNELSSDAKIVYGLLLDRMSLSIKNGWFDDENRPYIIYTLDNIMQYLNCSKPKCVKIMKELDCENGIGLIERKRQGLGNPDIIYVKNFATAQGIDVENEPINPDEQPEVKNLYFKKENNLTSGGKEIEPLEVKDFYPNNTEYNNTDINNTDSINQPTEEMKKIMMELRNRGNFKLTSEKDKEIINLILRNVEFDHFMETGAVADRALYCETCNIICDFVIMPRKTVLINQIEYPYEVVRSQFLKLNSSHVKYVIESLSQTTTKITNVKAYIIAMLYNASLTENIYFLQKARHELHTGQEEKKTESETNKSNDENENKQNSLQTSGHSP